MSVPAGGRAPPPTDLLTFQYLTSASYSSSLSCTPPGPCEDSTHPYCDSPHLDCSDMRSTLPDPDQVSRVTTTQPRVWGWLVPHLTTSPPFPTLELTRDNERYTVGRDLRCDLPLLDWMFGEEENRQCNKASRVQFGLYLDQDQPMLTDRSMNGTFVNRVLVGRESCTRLYHGDLVSILHEDLVMFEYLDQLTLVNKKYPVRITLRYLVANTIGSGGFSQVRKGFTRDLFQPVALKFVKKERWWEGTWSGFKEVDLLRSLRHPCITRVLDVEESTFQLVIVMEFAAGGDLQTRVLEDRAEGRLSETTAKFQFYQVSHAIAYLHSVNVCHRDLKLANILLMERDNPRSLIKVCDFGVSKKWSDNTVLATCVGTPLFVAPEVLTVGEQLAGHVMTYSCKSDCWSLGVVLYILLAGEPPFSQQLARGQLLSHQIKSGSYREMEGGVWDQVTLHAKDLVARLIKVKPSQRPPSAAILQHSWFSQDTELCMEAREKMAEEEKRLDVVYLERAPVPDVPGGVREQGPAPPQSPEVPPDTRYSPKIRRREDMRERLRPRPVSVVEPAVEASKQPVTPGRGSKRKEEGVRSVVFLLPGKRRRRNSEVTSGRPRVDPLELTGGARRGRKRRETGY